MDLTTQSPTPTPTPTTTTGSPTTSNQFLYLLGGLMILVSVGLVVLKFKKKNEKLNGKLKLVSD